ncbi:hypothetical protein QT381_12195 [Galbitalea sp. SE-J8]|uniref:hypothetical protein n=1 Tax=Galbitalea sp. SE-J8 TaxID=3054952 RepID=UPI00259CBCE0|nr:hypothetical protein [Galbitalea sp. SE-J8]MDM4763769.1 hypothetical protein [Galbitalea sp. SE-J8]
MTWQWASIAPIWALAALGAALVLVLRPVEGVLTWFPIVLALATIAAFLVQLGIRRREGFVTRVMVSVTGAVVVLGAATAVAFAVA